MHVKLEEDNNNEVQMGPMMDCVFLLLIFFIVIAVTKKSIKELGIRLPDISSAQKAKPKEKEGGGEKKEGEQKKEGEA